MTQSETQPLEPLLGVRILVVDDDAVLLELAGYSLESIGATVRRAPNGEAALALYQEERPDLVLCDVLMPAMDGYEVCRCIRAMAETPVILLTGRTEQEDIEEGMAAGATDFLTKPFVVRVLQQRVQQVLAWVVNDSPEGAAIAYVDDNLSIQGHRPLVTVRGAPVMLSYGEARLLHHLVAHEGQTVCAAKLIQLLRDDMWQTMDVDVSTFLNAYVAALRSKLEPNPAAATYITGNRKQGYAFRPLGDGGR